MAAISSQAKVGLLVIMATTFLALMTLRIEDMDVERGGYRITVFFDSVSGVERKSYVKVAGVEAGRVEEIELEKGQAKLTLYINPDVVLYIDSVASVRSMGLLGEKYIELTQGSPQKPRLRDGDIIIQVKETTDIDELTTTLGDVAEDIKAISASMRQVLGGDKGQETIQRIVDNVDTISGEVKGVIQENREQLRQVMENVNRLSANLDKLVAQNRELVNKSIRNVSEVSQQLREIVTTNRAMLERTMANLERISATWDKESPRLAKNANNTMQEVQDILKENRESLKKSMDKISQASEKLDKALVSVKNISEKVERGEGTLGKLFQDEEAYKNLNEGLQGLKGFFEKGKDWQVFVGVRSEYLFDASDAKTYLSLKLQPREDKFYLVEVIDDPRGRTEITTTRRTTTPPGTTQTVREEIDEDELKFSVQIAKKFYDFTIRGGLIESTGGVGLDYEPWGVDRVKFRIEAWDLGADDPHLKFTTNLYVYEQVFVNVGVDDILDKDFRSVFVGAGLLFSDQDLKSLLGGLALGAGSVSN